MLHGVNSKRQTGGVFSLLLLWVAGIALIYYICVMRDLPRVQNLLASQVISAVSGAGVANANVTLDGRDVILSGPAETQEEISAAGFAARGVYGVRHIRNEMQVATVAASEPAELKSPELSLQIAEDSIFLHGLVSSDNSAALIAEGVQQSYPTYTVENNITVDPETADPVWLENTISSLSVLKLMNEPEVDITDDQLNIRGSVDSDDARDSVLQELDLIYADTLTINNEIDVVVPPKLIEPELKLALVNNELTLSGQMHSSEELEKVASAAMGAFDLNLMNNELGVNTEVAQAIWLEPALELLPKLGDFESLELSLSSEQAKVIGTVDNDDQRQAALELIDATIGTILPVSEGISVKNPAVTPNTDTASDAEPSTDEESIPGVKTAQSSDDSVPGASDDNQAIPGANTDTESENQAEIDTSDTTEDDGVIPGDLGADGPIPGTDESVAETKAADAVTPAATNEADSTADTNEPDAVASVDSDDNTTSTTEGNQSESTAETNVADNDQGAAETEAVAETDAADTDTTVDTDDGAAETDSAADSDEGATETDAAADSDEGVTETDAAADSDEGVTETDAAADTDEGAADTDAAADSDEGATETDAAADSDEGAADTDAAADTDESAAGTDAAADIDESEAETNAVADTDAAGDTEETVAESDADASTVEADSASDSEQDSAEADSDEANSEASTVAESDASEPQAGAESLESRRAALTAALAEIDFNNVRFEENKSILTTESKSILSEVASVLAKFPAIGITINGYTDSVGSERANLVLSRSRAESVESFLISEGIAQFRLTALGHGESDPIADNGTPEGRALNRRIEFNY